MEKLFLGSFDCEKFWNDGEAELPKIQDRQAENCVLAMDELLNFLGKSTDSLLTRFEIDKAQADYLHELNIGVDTYLSLESFLEEKDLLWDTSKDVFSLMCEYSRKGTLKKSACELMPFSVLENTQRMSDEYAADQLFPNFTIVKRVNGKIFSTMLNYDMKLYAIGRVAESMEEIISIGNELLDSGSFIIKENYGVSGKGNLLVSSKGRFTSILNHLQKQSDAGKKIAFVLEPLIENKKDFSTQFDIGNNGDVIFTSVQILHNDEFSYKGSATATEEFVMFLKEKGYFKKLEDIGKHLFMQGYYGPVCIDSMVINDNILYEVVEINARMSMSYIKHKLDSIFEAVPERYFSYYNLKIPATFNYENLLIRMYESGLLYRNGNGILPLTSKMMTINKKSKYLFYRGRLYFMDIGGGNNQDKLKKILNDVDIKIL